MDAALYVVAAALLAVLLFFITRIRGQTERADQEHEQNVVVAATAAAGRPRPVPEQRADGMPRRRMNRSMQAQRRAQRMEEEREGNRRTGPDRPRFAAEDEADDEESSPAAQTSGKIGAKKQKKLEEKQARKAQREAEEAEREERKKQEMKREEERRKDEERLREEEEKQEEEKKKAKEEQEKREHEEYLRLKESFVVEEEGEAETMDEEQVSKVVILEDLGAHFGLRAQDAISRIQDLLADGSITGVIDDRGKFIYITTEELAAVAQFIRQRGRVSISELAQATNQLINLNPESGAAALTVT
ncbi:DDRGK domain-containing protein 1 isoform X3 [Ranitomeya imitator]|uniref:DDRGK domain-containing protein 1 isoform X3 n=1 Tax=Ranitomeya imitator TaxID=111125 RepID=UPI0037E72A2E